MGYKVKSYRPIDFIDFLYNNNSYRPFLPKLINLNNNQHSFIYKTEKGNPIMTKYKMKYGSDKKTIMEFIYYINKSTPPTDSNQFFQNVIRNLLSRRLKWVSDEIEKNEDPEIKYKWRLVKEMFIYQPPIMTRKETIQYPTPDAIWLDNEIVKNYIINYSRDIEKSTTDWAQVWSLCVDAFLFGQASNTGKFGTFIQMNAFLYQNAIASRDTILKMRKRMIRE
jgi:hypothetical protein